MNLSFRVGRIPVRIQPSFFLTALILGGLGDLDPARLALWTSIVLGSVLVHELGHALAGLAFGQQPRIDLHGFGGTTSWSTSGSVSAAKRIAVSLAGPGMGFAAGACVAFFIGAFGPGPSFVVRSLLSPFGLASPVPIVSAADYACDTLLFVNVGWGALNLLPMLPLDGGNVMAQVFVLGGRGERPARLVSLGVAGAATLAALAAHWLWSGLMAASFVASNWRGLKEAEARDHDTPLRANLELAYQALDAKDAQRVLSLAHPVALAAKTAPVRAEALQLMAFGFLLEGRIAEADTALAALPPGFSPHPRLAEMRANAARASTA